MPLEWATVSALSIPETGPGNPAGATFESCALDWTSLRRMRALNTARDTPASNTYGINRPIVWRARLCSGRYSRLLRLRQKFRTGFFLKGKMEGRGLSVRRLKKSFAYPEQHEQGPPRTGRSAQGEPPGAPIAHAYDELRLNRARVVHRR